MSTFEREGIIVLSGPTCNGELSHDTQSRLDMGLHLWQETGWPIILVGGSSKLMFDELGEFSHGPSEDEVYLESKSRDTVGNAVYSKLDILKPNRFTAANLVTADYHIRRASTIFRRILGSNFQVVPVGVETRYSLSELKSLQRKEVLYSMIAQAALFGYDSTSADDDQKAMARMRLIARSRYKNSI